MSASAAAASPRRTLRLRTIAVTVVVVAAMHVMALWVYLGVGVARRARAAGVEMTTVLDLFAELQERTALIRSAVALTVIPVPEDSAASADRAAQLRVQVERVGVRMAATPFAGVPAAMRIPLAQADDDLTRLESSLFEFAALLELERTADAARQRVLVDSLMTRLQARLAEAQEAGLTDLRRREFALHESARRASRALFAWVATGLILLGTVVWITVRRVLRPLAELDAGLRRVAVGELTTRVPVHRTDELGSLASLFNETARVLQERAEQQGRFAAAGELIAGVAHEVNNPLMAVAAIAEIQLGTEHLSPEIREEFRQIAAQAQRAGRLLSGLLRFVRPQAPVTGPVHVNGAVDRAVELLAFRLPVEQVEVVRDFADDLPPALGDPMRVEQVFVNLASNALDALRDVGLPRHLTLRTWRAGDDVYASVTDNGPGVPAEILPRLFAPFVSSKAGRGTGLGLYISRQIVRSAGGDLHHAPAPTGGTSFVVRLPRAPAGVPAEPAARPAGEPRTPSGGAASRAPASRQGRIATGSSPDPAPAASGSPPGALAELSVLIVDDEAAIRRVLERFLRRRGAEVATATDGADALDRLNEVFPDIVLMDLKMPGMSGAALYDRLRRDRPDLAARTIVLSGDLSQLEELGGRGAIPAERIVAKPIALQDLERQILAVVGRPR